jgi:hypothetical protein
MTSNNEVDDLDNKIAGAFRAKINQLYHDLQCSETEVAEGLRISRATLHSFLNPESKEEHQHKNKKKIKKMLPITPGDVVNLWQTLTQGKRRKKIPKYEDANKYRQLLKDRGPADLLAAAGFAPVSGNWIRVNSRHHPQMLKIALLLCSDWIDMRAYMELTQNLNDLLRERVNELVRLKECQQEETNLDSIEQTLLKHSILDPSYQEDLLDQYKRACNSFPKMLSFPEKVGLASSIILNKITEKDQLPLSLRVVGFEFKQLTIFIPQSDNWKKINQTFQKGIEIERKFISGNAIPPVIKAKVICRIGIDKKQNNASVSEEEDNASVIPFYFIANNTQLATYFNAVSLHLGFRYSATIFKVHNENLEPDINSLVKSTVVLEATKNDKNSSFSPPYFQGDWVEIDLIKAAIQSLVTAGKKLLESQLNQDTKQIYKNLVLELSSLRKQLYKLYNAAQDYNFSEQTVTIKSFQELSENSYTYLDLILESNSKDKIQDSFAVEFYRIYILSQIYRIRFSHILGDLKAAQKYIEDSKKVIESTKGKFSNPPESQTIIPIYILFKIEQKLLQLTLGKGDFWSKESGALDEWNEKNVMGEVENHLKPKENPEKPQGNNEEQKFYNDLGWVTFQVLAEAHFLIGQWLFYTKSKESDVKVAYKRFLEAAYFYSRIGISHRCSQSIALAGRALIRLHDAQQSEEAIQLVEYLIKSNLTGDQDVSYQKGLMSELYLLNAEYYAVIKEDYEKGIIESLKALKGSLWMGFTRRVTENLYTISRCAKWLGNREVIEDFKKEETFAVLWETLGEEGNTLTEELRKKLLSKICETDSRLKQVSRFLCDIKGLIDEEKEPLNWDDVADKFKEQAAKIWDEWYQEGNSQDDSQKHPIGEEIENETFLSPVSKEVS